MKRHKKSIGSVRLQSSPRRFQNPYRVRRLARGCFEPLEERTLLHGGTSTETKVLETYSASIDSADEVDEASLSLSGEGESALFGLQVHPADGSTFNPDTPFIQDGNGTAIVPIFSTANLSGDRDAIVSAELPIDQFTLQVGGEGGTVGELTTEIYLLGDLDGDGRMDTREFTSAVAAALQTSMATSGPTNGFTQRLFRNAGFDLTKPLYREEFDVIFDHQIDNLDLGHLVTNLNAPVVQSVIVIVDGDPPVIDAQLTESGRDDIPESFSDDITNSVSGDIVSGTLADESDIAFLRGSIDSTDPADIQEIPFDSNANTFALTLGDLEQLTDGASLTDTGFHTLFLFAEDERDNATEVPVEVSFSLDTVGPAAPIVDLTDSSDTGTSSIDDLTGDNTPTIDIDVDADALAELTVTRLDSGEVVQTILADSTGSISRTLDQLDDGSYQLSATATDIAGNVSGPAATPTVEIDTAPPADPTLTLDPSSDTGVAGDGVTSQTVVALDGITSPEATVRLEETGATTQSSQLVGDFTFEGIQLTFGENEFTVVASDPAGNEASATVTLIRNADPEAIDPAPSPIDVDEDSDPTEVPLGTLFNDDDLGSGDTLILSVTNSNPQLVSATLSDNDSADNILNDSLTLSYLADAHGSAEITVTATDQFGQTATRNISVTVRPTNDDPTQQNNGPLVVDEAAMAAVDSTLLSYTDIDGDDLDYTLTAVPNRGTLQRNDDVLDVNNTFTQADIDAGRITYHHDASETTSDGFDFDITDGTSTLSGTFSIVVNPTNDNPELATNETLQLDEGATAIIGNSLLATTDVDDDPLTYQFTSAPSNGTLLIDDLPLGVGGTFTQSDVDTDQLSYRHNGSETVSDSFDFNVSDNTVTLNGTFMIDVNPINDPPEVVDDAVFNLFIGDVAAGHLVGTLEVADEEMDTLGYSITGGTVDGNPIEGTEFEIDTDGDISVGAGATLIQGGEAFLLTVEVTDNINPPVTVTVSILIVENAPPILGTNNPLDVNEGAIGTIDSTVLETTDATQPPETLTYTLTSTPIHGSLRLNSSDLTVNDTFTQGDIDDGFVTYEHNGSQTTSDGFAFEVTDGTSTAVDTFDIVITLVNDNPEIVANLGGTVAEGQTLTISRSELEATDEETTSAIDLMYTISTATANGTLSIDGGATAMGLGGTFTQDDINSDRLQYTHDAGEASSDSFAFDIDDGSTGSTTGHTFDIIVTPINDEEQISINDGISTLEGGTVTIGRDDLLTTDVDNSPEELTYTVTTATINGGLTIDGGASTLGVSDTFTQDDIDLERLQYTHDGDENETDSFGFDVDDGQGTTSSDTFAITIQLVNDVPIIATNSGATGLEGGTTPISSAELETTDTESTPSELTYTITTAAIYGDLSIDGDITTLGNGDSFTQDDIDNDLLTYQHDGSETTTDSFSFTVSDGISTVPDTPDTFNISIDAFNDRPSIENGQSFSVVSDVPNGSLVGTVLASDPEGDSLSYEIFSGDPDNLFDIDSDGNITVADTSLLFPDTTFSLRVRATDSGDPAQNATATVTVNVRFSFQVQFRLDTTDLDGNPIDTVNQGDDFELRVFVEDVRLIRTGVFAAYLDVEFDNPDSVSLIFGETQQLQLTDRFHGQVNQLGEVTVLDFTSGSFFLTFDGQSTDPINFTPNLFGLTSDLRSKLEAVVGEGNVVVVLNSQDIPGTDDDILFRWDITFVGDLQGTDVPDMTVNTDALITADGAIPNSSVTEIFPADPENLGTFRNSFLPGELYGNGRAGIDESIPGLGVFSEAGSFSGRFEFNLQERFEEHLLFRAGFNANQVGQITFSGDPADLDLSDVLVFTTEPSDIPTNRIDYGSSVTIEIVPAPMATSSSITQGDFQPLPATDDTSQDSIGSTQGHVISDADLVTGSSNLLAEVVAPTKSQPAALAGDFASSETSANGTGATDQNLDSILADIAAEISSAWKDESV